MKATSINIYLLQKKVSQKEIADALELSKSTVSLLLSGRLKLQSRLDQIAEYLQITRRRLDSLIARNGSNHK